MIRCNEKVNLGKRHKTDRIVSFQPPRDVYQRKMPFIGNEWLKYH